jgi:hypothetical protein
MIATRVGTPVGGREGGGVEGISNGKTLPCVTAVCTHRRTSLNLALLVTLCVCVCVSHQSMQPPHNDDVEEHLEEDPEYLRSRIRVQGSGFKVCEHLK